MAKAGSRRSSLRTTSSKSPSRFIWVHASRACSATNPYGRCCRLHAVHADSKRSKSLRSCLVGAVGGGARRASASSTAAVCSLRRVNLRPRSSKAFSTRSWLPGFASNSALRSVTSQPARARTETGSAPPSSPAPSCMGIHPSCPHPALQPVRHCSSRTLLRRT